MLWNMTLSQSYVSVTLNWNFAYNPGRVKPDRFNTSLKVCITACAMSSVGLLASGTLPFASLDVSHKSIS